MSAYGTHLPVLAAAVARTTGPVLECGMGEWSSAILHLMCMGRRELVSLESDKEWLNAFSKYVGERHDIGFIEPKVETWVAYGRSLSDFYKDGVVFLDQAPGEARVPMAMELKGKAHFIVCHDTEADIRPAGGNYGWKQLDGFFKYQTIYKEMNPWTTVYSDVEEFLL